MIWSKEPRLPLNFPHLVLAHMLTQLPKHSHDWESCRQPFKTVPLCTRGTRQRVNFPKQWLEASPASLIPTSCRSRISLAGIWHAGSSLPSHPEPQSNFLIPLDAQLCLYRTQDSLGLIGLSKTQTEVQDPVLPCNFCLHWYNSHSR